jgi:hypothetical protein
LLQASFACGSMVHFLAFSQKFCTECKIFVKKDVQFRPAGGEAGHSSRQMPDLKLTA